MFSYENGVLSDMMGVETLIPPIAMDAAAPEGAPPRRINLLRKKTVICPPCLGEAPRRGTLLYVFF